MGQSVTPWGWLILPALVLVLMVPSRTSHAQIEEVVVTVRKKEESLLDVPISVDVLTTQQIERKGIDNIAGVAKYTASVQFDESFAQSDTRLVIRGLSPTRGRQNAAFLLDGIDVSSEAITSSGGSLLINTRLVDVQRIEVVLGPQMALYGRSAFNGAVNYVTRDPSEDFEVEVTADGNDEDQYQVTGSLSGPLIGDNLGFRLNAALWDNEGFFENGLTGDEIGGEEGFGLALALKSQIGENLSLRFRAEYNDDEGNRRPRPFCLSMLS